MQTLEFNLITNIGIANGIVGVEEYFYLEDSIRFYEILCPRSSSAPEKS